MIVHFPYPRHVFVDFLRTRRESLVASTRRAQEDVAALSRGEGASSPEGRLRLRVAREARAVALRREGERESVSAAVRNLLVAAFLSPDLTLPPYGILAAKSKERVGSTSVSLSPCEPVYIVLLRRTGLRTLHNLVDHLFAVPAVVEMAHALFRLPPGDHDQVIVEACALAAEEAAGNAGNYESSAFS